MTQTLRPLYTVLLLGVFFLSASGCGKTSSMATSSPPAGAENTKRLSSVYEIDRLVELEPVKLRIVNVGVVSFENSESNKGQIALGLEIANLGNESIRFFPEQIVLNTNLGKDLYADISLSSDIGGTFPAGRVKKGFILFPLPEGSPDAINHLTVKFAPPQDLDYKPLGKELKVEIELKQVDEFRFGYVVN